MDVKRMLGHNGYGCNGFDGAVCDTHKSAIEFSLSSRARGSSAPRSTKSARVNGVAARELTADHTDAEATVPASVLRVAARRASQAKAAGVRSDDLRLASELLAKAKGLPAVRQRLLDRAAERIEAGVYDNARILDKTVEAMLDDLAD